MANKKPAISCFARRKLRGRDDRLERDEYHNIGSVWVNDNGKIFLRPEMNTAKLMNVWDKAQKGELLIEIRGLNLINQELSEPFEPGSYDEPNRY